MESNKSETLKDEVYVCSLLTPLWWSCKCMPLSHVSVDPDGFHTVIVPKPHTPSVFHHAFLKYKLQPQITIQKDPPESPHPDGSPKHRYSFRHNCIELIMKPQPLLSKE